MRNEWSNAKSREYTRKYKSLGFSKDMALRVYTTRLLGRNKELVLHGGGNTSVKTTIKDIDGIIISDYEKGICSELLIKEVMKLSKENKVPVYVDPKGNNWDKYKYASLITPNTIEVESILGDKLILDKDFEVAGGKICDIYNIDACLITRGSDGMSYVSEKNIFHLRSEAQEIFDVSGAGDTVISAMVTGLAIDLTSKEAAEFSNQAAGIVVGHIGTSAITTQELLDLN